MRAAFEQPNDRRLVGTAASRAVETIEALFPTHPDAMAQGKAACRAYLAIYEAIEEYKALRLGPPLPPPGGKDTPRRPLRERVRTLVTRLLARFRMSARILFLGHRPATVGYDAVDRRIAENCAYLMAVAIARRDAPPQPTVDEEDVCREIARFVYQAIEAYVTRSVESECIARDLLAKEEERRLAKGGPDTSDIPFGTAGPEYRRVPPLRENHERTTPPEGKPPCSSD